jgi:hypothetical protein
MGVYKLSRSGSLRAGRTLYNSMEAANQYGAMVHIATLTGSGSSNGVTFTNIPQTFKHLYLVANGGNSTSGASTLILVTFNGTYPNPLSQTHILGNGASATSSRVSNNDKISLNGSGATIATSTNRGTYIAHMIDYASTNTFKTILCRSAEDQNGSGISALTAGVFRSTSPITGFNVSQIDGANTPTSSTFSLYGIKGSN